MSISMFDLAIFTLLVCFYILFVTWFSIRNRIRLAEEVDAYLGGDNPRKLKQTLFAAFSFTKMPFAIFRITWHFFSVMFNLREKPLVQELAERSSEKAIDRASVEQTKELKKLGLKCFSIALQRSPISTVLSITILFVFLIILGLLNKGSLLERGLNELPELMESFGR